METISVRLGDDVEPISIQQGDDMWRFE
jgi:hypothetical protein